MKKSGFLCSLLLLPALFLMACGKSSADSVPASAPVLTATPGVTSTPEPTATPEPTDTPVPTATSAPTVTPEPTATPKPTPTPEPTATPKPTPVPVSGQKVIYLTFDDGPGLYTKPLLELLDKYNIKATFFVCGTSRAHLIKDIYDAGHTVGMHCKYHDYETVYASEEAYFEDLYAIQDIIFKYTGTHPTILRFPGGSSNKVSSFNPGIMTRLTKLVEEKGFSYFDWNVSSGDTGTKDTETITKNLIEDTTGMRYAISLQHSEIKEYSLNAIEGYLIWALENGYTFATLTPESPKAHHRLNN